MSENQALDHERVMDLVADALTASIAGTDPESTAVELVKVKQPTLRELAAARSENHDIHGGGTPEALRNLLPPSPVSEEVARLRRMIDDVLVAAEGRLRQVRGPG